MKYRKSITSIIPVLISVSCLYVFYVKVDDFSNFFNEIGTANYSYVLLATIFLCVTVWLRAIRWGGLLGGDNRIYGLFKIQMIGYFSNNILPFRAGELLKSFLISKQNNISKSYALGTVIMERFLDMLMLLMMTIICIFISPISNIGEFSIYYLLFIVLGIIGIFLFFYMIISRDLVKINIVRPFLDQFILTYKNLKFRQLFYLSLYGCAIWFIYWINVVLIFKAFNIPVEPYESLLILVVASIINSVPSLPGAIGTFHLGVELTLRAFNIMGNEFSIYPFTTVLHLYGYISLTVIGMYYFIVDKSVGFGKFLKFKR